MNMKRHRLLRQISRLVLIFSVSQFCCSGDEVTPRPPIADVSVSGPTEAWIVTRDGKLFHLEGPGQVNEVTSFRGKARLVYFVRPSVGWVLDSDGQFWNMTDGANWQQRGALGDLTTRLHASHLAFANEQVGWL